MYSFIYIVLCICIARSLVCSLARMYDVCTLLVHRLCKFNAKLIWFALRKIESKWLRWSSECTMYGIVAKIERTHSIWRSHVFLVIGIRRCDAHRMRTVLHMDQSGALAATKTFRTHTHTQYTPRKNYFLLKLNWIQSWSTTDFIMIFNKTKSTSHPVPNYAKWERKPQTQILCKR